MFANNSYAKVWKIFPKEKPEQKFTMIQLSTSKKNKQTNKYETDFSGYVRLIGKAEEKAPELQAEDRIQLLNTGVTNKYDKETKKTTTSFLCFEFNIESGSKSNDNKGDEWVKVDEIPDNELPFAD